MVSGPRRRPRAGFTLIELTLAVVLLAIGLLALIGALGRALEETQAARLRHAALRQAESAADSLSRSPVTRGYRVSGPIRVEWRPEACAAGACVRVVAFANAPARDTVALLARLSANEP